ncbi:MAG: hypothetical protein U0807_03500 [Candidatus Binatia bacterium]
MLVDLALSSGLVPFRDRDGAAYATVDVDGHIETWRLRSAGLRAWLARQYYAVTRRTPNAAALVDAVQTLVGIAQYDGDVEDVHVRLAERNGVLYLDLADAGWRVVEIGLAGWRVLDQSPVRFRRTKGMQPLPEPQRGGRVDDLRPFVNAADADWRLVAAWLVGTLRPGRPFPVLALYGEHGSGKSTQARMLRRLVDPNLADLRSSHRDERDLVIAAQNGWIIGLDNLSKIPDWLSDALCRVSTGAGFSTRTLYTDEDESLFAVQRPVVFTSIDEVIARDDLADRALIVTLPRIADAARRTEEALWARYDAARPALLGALLTAASAALAALPDVRLESMPRMADFARWSAAAETALGWTSGAFVDAYAGNRKAAAETVLEASAIGAPLRALLVQRPDWSGTSTELLRDLVALTDETTRGRRDWPATPRGLSGQMRRLAPDLRLVGVVVDWFRAPGDSRPRLLRIVASDRPDRPDRPGGSIGAADSGTVDPDPGRSTVPADSDRPAENARPTDGRDGRDGRDDDSQVFTGQDPAAPRCWVCAEPTDYLAPDGRCQPGTGCATDEDVA